ncbi:galactoside 2-alpha-L-fucosyltransferase isoform X2 [Brachypodium distachyon]|uniref:Fucosyltransferase n=1 Tax=Brachypodium distachyon TaxID=15368 RepID=A0A0Q3H7M2_BRADI|nr:galactoside 2-alpha-L-fucosyltransferase isoform X2 [Brachypodium distachyon]KQK19032.1 hypothetical protein BRADI_1g46020v3 [Brachypodium distachyon]|eukprot:XP_010229902.2 galactoside 2-alpha-L-fucosyltransferase isoform X2 [Brachypodium distachyon]
MAKPGGRRGVVILLLSLPLLLVLFLSADRRVLIASDSQVPRLLLTGQGMTTPDRLLGGLLAEGVDEKSCHSRYQSAMYRRNAGRKPSPYLATKLRRHEALQRRCGPGTAAYNNAVEQLRSGENIGSSECKYLVSISYRGLGNRLLAAASAFLYAVLTGRVLLVDPSNEMGELFCEPFPDTTWLLPPDFPLVSYTNFSVGTAESYRNMLKNNKVRDQPLPAFAYIHLDHDATKQDQLFFCDEDQRHLRDIQWLVMRTDNYIVPGLFLVTGFQEELDMLFPEPDTAFHHLGRYLFHPNNRIWGLVTRYYDAYLAAVDQRVGIQVRVFGIQPESPELLEQITKCTQKENLLPEVILGTGTEEPAIVAARKPPLSKAVLVTSLKSWYYEKIKSMYWEHATATGEAVGVHQPSHEEYQRFGAKSHDAKAWAEIYLLSLTDVLVTSGWSTFGYVAQGLGGLTPWVMYKPDNGSTVADPPCGRDISMEPCFHAPPFYDCRLKRGADTGKIVPHVRHCKDVSWGLKLVHRSDRIAP